MFLVELSIPPPKDEFLKGGYVIKIGKALGSMCGTRYQVHLHFHTTQRVDPKSNDVNASTAKSVIIAIIIMMVIISVSTSCPTIIT